MENNIKDRQLAFLEDTIKFYSEDVSRRAITGEGRCMYRTADGRKCAIGRHIPDDKYTKVIETSSVGELVMICLPEEIQELGKSFLNSVQMLHDNDIYWNQKGLSIEGEGRIECIKENINSNKYNEEEVTI